MINMKQIGNNLSSLNVYVIFNECDVFLKKGYLKKKMTVIKISVYSDGTRLVPTKNCT